MVSFVCKWHIFLFYLNGSNYFVIKFKTKKKILCNNVDHELDERCNEFPRFYFLDRDELIETLSHSRDLRKYNHVVRKLLDGVQELVYNLPDSLVATSGSNSESKSLKNLAFDINGSNILIYFNFI